MAVDSVCTFEPGEIQPQLTRIKCETCHHEWHPRRGFDGIHVPF